MSLEYRADQILFPHDGNIRPELMFSGEQRQTSAQYLAEIAFAEGFEQMPTPESSFQRARKYLRDNLIEQDLAIEAVIEALDASRVRLDDDPQAIATLAFLGPTGVGKSQLAKLLAEYFSPTGDDSRLVKIDCSDYSEGHEVALLTGSPPGYVGREQKALLSRKRIERKGTIVLFDEIEKGSPELNNILLQITEDGKLTLKNGDVTSFRDAIIIYTSNLGAEEMANLTKEHKVGFGTTQNKVDHTTLDQAALRAFEKFFKPEFVNRIDSKIVFHPLSENGLSQVLDVKLNKANEEFEEEHGARISLSEGAREHLIADALKERHMGARPMVRALKKKVFATFGQYVGSNAVQEGTHLHVYHNDEIPPQHAPKDRELVFYAKRDSSIRRREEPGAHPVLFSEADEVDMVAAEKRAVGNELVGPLKPTSLE